MKERIIRLLGGYTRKEVTQNYIKGVTFGKLSALDDVRDCMRQNNGESPDVWCKNVWQYVCDEIDKLTNQE